MTFNKRYLVGLIFVPLLALGACSSDESSDEPTTVETEASTNPDQEALKSLWISLGSLDLQEKLCSIYSKKGIEEAGIDFQAFAVGQGQSEVRKENAETFLKGVCDSEGGVVGDSSAP
jgi:hypothetical protein